MFKLVLLYLVLISLLAYVMFWLDKRRAAKGGRRISERELILWVVAGGSPGAILAMRRLRHKTKKVGFRVAIYGITALQIVLCLWLIWK